MADRGPYDRPTSASGDRPGTGATGIFPAPYVRVPQGTPPPPPARRGRAGDRGGQGRSVQPAGNPRPPQQPGADGPPQPAHARRQPGRDDRVPAGPRRLVDYPRAGRHGVRRWLPSWKLLLGLACLGLLALVAVVGIAYRLITLPPVDAEAQAQTSVVYFGDGKTPIGQFVSQNRQNVELAQVPTHVQRAVLAAEDRTFYSNSGIDPTSIARAAWSNVRGNALQGGSTISQQYVKNVYDQRDVSVQRKVKEVFLAVKINRSVPKPEILQRYLNTIYFGRGAYGIQAASRAYFKKDVGKLTVSEGAVLAGVINAPSEADMVGEDPKAERQRALRRWNVVLDAMVAEKWLDAGTRSEAAFPKIAKPAAGISVRGQNGYLLDMVRNEAAKLGLDEKELQSGGYRIVTTFNQRLVDAGVQAVRATLPKDRPKLLQIGMASVEPRTGAVRAIYGGAKYVGRENNNATISEAQAGSTFKPFALVAALEDGVSLRNTYSGSTPLKLKDGKVENFDNESFGDIDLLKATEQSVNTAYVRLNQEVGPPVTREVALRAGIPERPNRPIATNVANVLGSSAVRPIDMADAYATFAAQGIRHPWYTIETVTSSTGKKVYRRDQTKARGKRVFEAGVMADTSYALQQVVRAGTGTYARRLDRPVAGKTGTSSDALSAWFVGYTPQLSTSVAMYQLNKERTANVAMKGFGEYQGRGIFGGGYPARIWTAYMQEALKGKPVVDFPEPVYGGDVTRPARPAGQPSTPTAQPSISVAPQPSATPTPTFSATPTPSASEPEPEPSEEPTVEPSAGPEPSPSEEGPGGPGDEGDDP